MNTCPRDKLDDFITNSFIYHRNYKEYNTALNKPMKKVILVLKCIMIFLLVFLFFILGVIYERYSGFENFLKSQSKIEYNTTDYKYYRNYKYKI